MRTQSGLQFQSLALQIPGLIAPGADNSCCRAVSVSMFAVDPSIEYLHIAAIGVMKRCQRSTDGEPNYTFHFRNKIK